jgi:hypothetical protein
VEQRYGGGVYRVAAQTSAYPASEGPGLAPTSLRGR